MFFICRDCSKSPVKITHRNSDIMLFRSLEKKNTLSACEAECIAARIQAFVARIRTLTARFRRLSLEFRRSPCLIPGKSFEYAFVVIKQVFLS